MPINPWIDYLNLQELQEFLEQAGYEPNERITPRAICCDPVYTQLGFVVVNSGEIFWHPQNPASDLSVVLDYWRANSTGHIQQELNDWDSQLRGRTAKFAGKEIVHLYTSSGNIDLADIAVKLLVNKERITGDAIILDEYGNVLGLAKDLIRNT